MNKLPKTIILGLFFFLLLFFSETQSYSAVLKQWTESVFFSSVCLFYILYSYPSLSLCLSFFIFRSFSLFLCLSLAHTYIVYLLSRVVQGSANNNVLYHSHVRVFSFPCLLFISDSPQPLLCDAISIVAVLCVCLLTPFSRFLRLI